MDSHSTIYPVRNQYLESQVFPLLPDNIRKRCIREGILVKYQKGLLRFGGFFVKRGLRLFGQASDLIKL